MTDGLTDAVYRGLPDDAIWACIRERLDEAALRAFLFRHGGRLLASARSFTGDDATAHDAVQEAMIRLMRDRAKLPNHAAAMVWLYRVVNRAARQFRRSERRRKVREAVVGSSRSESVPSLELPSADATTQVSRAVAELPERERRAVELVYFEGMTHAAAAEALGWSRGAVGSYLTRALVRLEGLLARRGVTAVGGVVGALEIPTVALSAYEAARMAAVVMRRCSEEMVRWVPIVLKVTLVAAVVTSAGFIWVGGAANPILPVPVSPRLETLAEKNERLFRRDVLPELLAELRKMLPEDNSPQLAEVRAFGSAVECEFVTAKVLLPDSGRTRLRLSYCTVRRRMEVTVDLFGDGMWKVIDPKRPVIFEFDVFGLGRLNADTGHERIAFGQSAFEKIPADGQAVDELIRRTFGEPANELILPVGVTAVSGDGNRPLVVAHDHGLFDWDGREWRYRGECSGWFLTLVGDRFYADRDGVISRRVDDTGGRWETVAHRPPEDWNKFRVCGMAVAGGRLHYSVHRHPDGATALWTKLLSDPQAKWVRGEMVAHPNHLIGAGDWLFSVDVDNALVRRSAAEPTAAWERLGRLPTAPGEIQAIGDRLLAFDRAKGSIFARPLAGSAVEWQVIGRIRSRNADRTFDK